MRFITIKKSHYEADLLVLKLKLESEGINCFLHNEFTTQVMNYMPAFNVELKVEERDLRDALKIISEWDDDSSHLKIVD